MLSMRRGTMLVTFFVITVLIVPAYGQVTRRIAPPTCTTDLNADTLTSTFVVEINDDDINYIAGCRLNETTNKYEFETCNYEINELNGKTYFTIETIINLEDASDAATTNPCGFIAINNNEGTLDYQFRIAFRRLEGYVFLHDADYRWTCERDNALDTYLTASFEAIFDTLVTPDVVNPSVVLTVANLDGTPSTNCIVGELRKLKLAMTYLVTYEDYLLPYGIHAWKGNVGRTKDDVMDLQNTRLLIRDDGCKEDGNPIGMVDGFGYDQSASNSQTRVYYSGEFVCRRFMDTNQLWFSVQYGFCRGPIANLDSTSDKCHDFCEYKLGGGVRKREAEGSIDEQPKEVYATLTITDGTDRHTENESGPSTMLIVVTVSVVLVVLALLVVFGCFMFYMAKKQRRDETKSYPSHSSWASSDRKLPVKF